MTIAVNNSNAFNTATLGGGCFWCVEAILDEIIGVVKVVSGYSGGEKESPTYQEVCNGNTGHAEVVQVIFNTAVLSYRDLLIIFLSMHNTNIMNRQTDGQSQYRSVIFYHNHEQKCIAQQVMHELQNHVDEPILTALSPFIKFYKAEEYHQQYYKRDQDKPYCQSVINPKIIKWRQYFEGQLKSKTLTH